MELGGDGACQLAELDRLGAQRDRGVEPREVEQLLGERGEALQLAPRGRHLALGVGDVGAPLLEVLLEQLHRALEHGQRRAQLVRGGGHEGAPRRLLAAQLLLHARERAGQVADLVVAGVARHRDVRALVRDPQRRGPQPAEAARQRAGEQEREREGDEQADAGGGEQRVAHLLDRVADLGQPPPRHDHADHAAVAVERDADGEVVAAHLDHGLLAVDRADGGEEGLARRRPALGVGEEAGRRVLLVGGREREVGDQHAPRRLVGQLERLGAERDLAVDALALRERVLEARPRGEHGGAQALGALVAQALLQRAEHDCRGGGERHRAREHERHQQPPAQASPAQAQVPSHASRKR